MVENSQMLSQVTHKGMYTEGETVSDLDREGQLGLRKVTARSHTGAYERLNTKKGQGGHGLGFSNQNNIFQRIRV